MPYTEHDVHVIYIAAGASDTLRAALLYADEHEPNLCVAFYIAEKMLLGAKPRAREQLEEQARELEPSVFVSRLSMDETVPGDVQTGYQLALRLLRAAYSDNPGQEVCRAIHRTAEIIEEDIYATDQQDD